MASTASEPNLAKTQFFYRERRPSRETQRLYLTPEVQLSNDCNELKNMFRECFIADYGELGASRVAPYALRK